MQNNIEFCCSFTVGSCVLSLYVHARLCGQVAMVWCLPHLGGRTAKWSVILLLDNICTPLRIHKTKRSTSDSDDGHKKDPSAPSETPPLGEFQYNTMIQQSTSSGVSRR